MIRSKSTAVIQFEKCQRDLRFMILWLEVFERQVEPGVDLTIARAVRAMRQAESELKYVSTLDLPASASVEGKSSGIPACGMPPGPHSGGGRVIDQMVERSAAEAKAGEWKAKGEPNRIFVVRGCREDGTLEYLCNDDKVRLAEGQSNFDRFYYPDIAAAQSAITAYSAKRAEAEREADPHKPFAPEDEGVRLWNTGEGAAFDCEAGCWLNVDEVTAAYFDDNGTIEPLSVHNESATIPRHAWNPEHLKHLPELREFVAKVRAEREAASRAEVKSGPKEMSMRKLARSAFEVDMNRPERWQQFIDGEWRDVPIVTL